jgi:hypothetical protein
MHTTSLLFSHLPLRLRNVTRLVVHYERRADNFLGLAHLGCIVILLGRALN